MGSPKTSATAHAVASMPTNDSSVTLPTTREEALAEEIRERRREIWLQENREAIEAYNELVTSNGVFSAGLRGF